MEPDFADDDYGPLPPRGPMNLFSDSGDFRNKHYREAYGDYNGGYAPAGFRPGPMFSPYEMPGPNFGGMGRGYGPMGPPGMRPRGNSYDGARKFLTRCGLLHEQIKQIPKPLLEMIHPFHCGLCCMDLESFVVAKVHYLSKNHFKNQKKWIANFQGETQMGPKHSREMPIRSRDLYCELCDVHITSKVHAESHYAGKSHRSVVEGRKPPKNRFLLQHGMEGRLEQLIRREKRNLKASDAAVEQEADNVKPVPPELICAICDTTVTNSEQMTMHLNGKRHLTREKQHILKMMRGGEAPAAPSASAVAPSATAVAQNVNAEVSEVKQEQSTVETIEAPTPVEDDLTQEWQNGGGGNW